MLGNRFLKTVMYSIGDYLYNGWLYVHNLLLGRHKTLSQLMIYSTTRCQARCQHCSIWKKEDESLSLEDIVKMMGSRCVTPRTTVGLEGGEFVLHPQAAEIMDWFMHNHPNYTLLSNCLAPKKVIDYVLRYKPKHLFVSLDGGRDTYIRMRGRDGYDKVIEVVDALKDKLPVSLMFCLSPWNSFADMEYVVQVAKEKGIDVRIGIYGTMSFFDTTAELMEADIKNFVQQIPANVRDTEENYDFIALYDEWRNGNLKLRCQSIFSELVVHSNGDVPICQNLDVMLGNLHSNTLDEIFNSKHSRELQCRYSRECNGCWINFHRKYDIIILRSLEKFIPKSLIEMVYGKYSWSENPKETYAQYMRRIGGNS